MSPVQVVAFCRQDCIGALGVGQTVAHVSCASRGPLMEEGFKLCIGALGAGQTVAHVSRASRGCLMEEGFKLCTGALGVGQTVAHVSRASCGLSMEEGFQLQISHYAPGLAPTPVSLACESCEALAQVCRWSL